MENIIWKEAFGFNGLYQVSNTGLIKSMDRETTCRYIYKVNRRGKILKERLDTQGYNRAILYVNGKKFGVKVHRIVAKAFIENPNNYPDVNHINGVKSDNRVENLEWCTKSMNCKHRHPVLKKSCKNLTWYKETSLSTQA